LSSKAAYGISTGVGLVAAPVFGAIFGGIKGRVRAKETLQNNKEKARYGERDTSKQRTATVDMTGLSDKLNKLVEEIERTEDEEEKSKKLALLSVRIEHSMSKVESGQVNFGDKKSLLVNQMNFNEALNKAMVLKATSSKEVNEEVEKRIENILNYVGKGTKNITSEREKIFIKKQMKQAALIGAGAATLGYLIRWFGEEKGWWGSPHTDYVKSIAKNPPILEKGQIPNIPKSEDIILPKDTVDPNELNISSIPDNTNEPHILPPPDTKQFTERAEAWTKKATNHVTGNHAENIEKSLPQHVLEHKPATFQGYNQPLNIEHKPATCSFIGLFG
jgi:hypothetical protein